MAFTFWDFDKEPILIAILTGQYKNVGMFHKNVFCFKIDKRPVHVWALMQLQTLLYGVPFGTELKITYLGKKPAESGRLYKDFSIEILNPPTPPSKQKRGLDIDSMPE